MLQWHPSSCSWTQGYGKVCGGTWTEVEAVKKKNMISCHQCCHSSGWWKHSVQIKCTCTLHMCMCVHVVDRVHAHGMHELEHVCAVATYITYYELRITYHVLRLTSYVLRTTYYVLRTTYYVLRTTYYVLRIRAT